MSTNTLAVHATAGSAESIAHIGGSTTCLRCNILPSRLVPLALRVHGIQATRAKQAQAGVLLVVGTPGSRKGLVLLAEALDVHLFVAVEL
jgi:hypothetical protein